MTNSELISLGNEIFQEIDHRETHHSQDFSLTDTEGTEKIIDKLTSLSSKITKNANPTNLEEVYLNELKDECDGGIYILNEELSPDIASPESILKLYSIVKEDMDKVIEWILINKQNVITANLHQYEKYSNIKKSNVPLGDPKIRHKAEDLLITNIEKVKSVLLRHPKHANSFKELFKNYHISTDSFINRSHANRDARYALLSTSHFIYASKGDLGIEMSYFLSVFGHEVLGHAANYMYTDKADMPFYLQWGFNTLTTSTKEAIAQYFGAKIFDYIKECSDYSDLFTGDHTFEEVYKHYEDLMYLQEYKRKLNRVGIWIMCQSKMDDTAKQIEELSKYSIERKWPALYINRHRNEWNRATGLLLPKAVSELRYCVDVLGDMVSSGLSTHTEFDKTIRTGMWTPQGLKEYAKVVLS